MRQETKENLANLAYPAAVLGVVGLVEYFGIGNSMRDFEAGRLEFTKEFYGSLNPAYWIECLNSHVRPFVLEAMASFVLGGLAGACIAEPIKKIINRRR